jgi:VWFA-related protein
LKASAFVFCAALAMPTAAQAPPVEFSAGTDQVLVDVLALDSAGRPIADLQRDDFEILDEGAPRPLISFEAVRSLASEPTASGSAIEGFASNARAAQDRGRVFLLAFDDNHLSPVTARAVRTAVAEFIGKLRAGDHVWLVPTSGLPGYRGTLPEGGAALLTTLDALQGRRPQHTSRDSISDYEALLAVRRDPDVLAQLRKRFFDLEAQTNVVEILDPTLGGGTDSSQARAAVTPSGLDMVTGRIVAQASEVYTAARTRRTATLQAVARALDLLDGFRGRKTVLLLSEGFIEEPTAAGRQQLIDTAQHANAALYFVDARGLVGGAWTHTADLSRPADQREQFQVVEDVNRIAAGADSVALDTGGFTLRNSNDIAAGLDRVARESESYYLLGYEPPAGTRVGDFRKIRVRVKRDGVELRARKGYYVRGPQAPALAATRLRSLGDAPFDAGGIPLRLASYVAGSSAGRTSVILEAEVDPTGLGASVETLAVMAPETGDPLRKEGTVSVKATRADPLGARWAAIEQGFSLPPGTYDARLVVRDPQSGRVGSVRQRIVVPEAEGFRTSTPVLTDTLEEVQGGQLPVMLARRHFAPGSKLFGMFEVFGAAAGPQGPKVTVGYGLRAADGKSLATKAPSPLPPGPGGDLTQTLVVPLEKMPQGRYELVLQIRDEVAGKLLERREAFVVGDPVAVAKAAASTPTANRNAAGYLALVDGYRKGDASAATALSSWTLAELKPGIDAARGGQGCDEGCRRAAAVLHLDAALAAEDRGDAPASAAHVAAGRQLLEKTKDERFRGQWLLAVGYQLLGEARLREAESVLEESVKAGNTDALLALGAIWDFRSTLDSVPPGTHLETPPDGWQSLPRFQIVAYRAQGLGKAEDFYRRVLQARPDLAEAHLRLGRVLLRREKPDQAAPELEIAAGSDDPLVRQLALLLLGDVAEKRGRIADAIASYKAALVVNPRSQAAHMALSYAQVRSGERSVGIATVREAATSTPAADEPMDGWLAYHLGPSRHLAGLLRSLREGLGS